MIPRLLRTRDSDSAVSKNFLATVRALSRPLRSEADLDPLLERIGDARYVLLGEASHGTREFYTWRGAISRRLIEEKGFSFVAVEGDWPDCYRVNRWAKGFADADDSAHDALHTFERWPTWMWANEEVVDFIQWLRRYNDDLAKANVDPKIKVGFYGLDVYSLWDSLYQVMGFLAKTHPDAVAAARRAFQCFEPYGEDVQEYARATRWVDRSCEDEVVGLLAQLRQRAKRSLGNNFEAGDPEASFNAEQNAIVVKNAEHYYRTMVQGGAASWNVRDRHMVETLDRLIEHHGPESKAIVWEHNTHVGDARYTDMAGDGMVNVGELVREQHLHEGVVLVGFSSYQGTVIAGQEWEAPMEVMQVPRGRPGSWEDVLHRAQAADRLLLFDESTSNDQLLKERGHRAIGVVYHPEYEQHGNYVPTVMPLRYDALLYIDRSQAVRPLQQPIELKDEVPETFPTGM